MANKAEFGMDVLRATQSANGSTSHKGREAWDFGGANTGGAGAIDKWYAKGCSWKVMNVQSGGDHFVYFQTTEPVLRANGTLGYVTLALAHMNNTSAYKVGQVFAPGQHMYTEGSYTGGRIASSSVMLPHIHAQAGDGPFAGTYLPQKQNYRLPNEAKMQDMLCVPDNVKISAAGGATWIRSSKVSQATSGGSAGGSNAADYKVRIYSSREAKESFDEASAIANKAKASGGEVVLFTTKNGDKKTRIAYSRSPAREYTTSTRRGVVGLQITEMGNDEILMPTDKSTRVYILEGSYTSHSAALAAADGYLRSGDPFCIASPNGSGRGATWAVGRSFRAWSGRGAAQMEAAEKYLKNEKPGNYVIG